MVTDGRVRARGDPRGQVAAELGPEVAHQIRLAEDHADERRPVVEVAFAFLLPARHQGSGPVRIGRGVDALVHRRRRALEHVEVLGVPTEVRHQLDAGRAGADEGDPLVGQLVSPPSGVAAGVVVVPTRGVEHVSPGGTVVLDAGDAGQFRAVVGTLGHHDEPRADLVAAVGADLPPLQRVVPAQFAHLGGEQRTVVETEVLADVAAVAEDLGAVGELLRSA